VENAESGMQNTELDTETAETSEQLTTEQQTTEP
jgi:hypothetical protein